MSKRAGGARHVGRLAAMLTIRAARPEDIGLIHALAAECALTRSADPAAGFLVSDYSAGDYAAWLERADWLALAELNARPAGFLLLTAHEHGELVAGPALLVEQVAVAGWARRAGIARALYHAAIERFPGHELVAEIIHEPRNESSIAFHHALGFKLVREFAAGERSPYRHGLYQLEA